MNPGVVFRKVYSFEILYGTAIPRASHPIPQISQCSPLPGTVPTIGSTNLTPLSSGGL